MSATEVMAEFMPACGSLIVAVVLVLYVLHVLRRAAG